MALLLWIILGCFFIYISGGVLLYRSWFWVVFISGLTYFLAKRKNLNATKWTCWVFGIGFFLALFIRNVIDFLVFFSPIMVIVILDLAFRRYLCPKCKERLTNQQAKEKFCPKCGEDWDKKRQEKIEAERRRIEIEEHK